jgi:hypothetical protein
MSNNTPENDSPCNGLVILPATKPQTIREYLASSSNAAFNEQVKAACAKRGLDLDSPWPMKLGGVAEPAQAPESAARRDSLLILPEDRLTADDLRRRMAEREAKDKPDSVEYQHSLLCALTLPRRRQPTREYRRDYQGRSLKLVAGELWNGKDWIPQPLPYGPKARLAFMNICSEAVRAQSRFLEIEKSARAFMKKIGIDTDDGKAYRLFRQQMNALAACCFLLGYTKPDGKAATLKANPIEEFEAWVTNDDGQPALWASQLILGEVFFADLIKHAVPLSGNAIRGLSHSALALDVYGLFAYRLHALEKPVFVSFDQFKEQIGQEYQNIKDFKKEFLPAVKSTLEVYPSAKVEQVKGGLLLKPSPPPIARTSVAVSRGLADKVKASLPPPAPEAPLSLHRLHPRTVETFRKRYPRLDPYACEADFMHFLNTGAAEQPRNFDAAFMGFAKKWAESHR